MRFSTATALVAAATALTLGLAGPASALPTQGAVLPAAQAAERAPLAYRVFATREGLVGGTTANGHVIVENDQFVALPSRRALSPKGTGTYTVEVCGPDGRCAFAPVWDVGPWNTRDDYWNPPSQRQEWRDLPQGVPEAQAARADGYNGGKDQYGRTVANPAGIDLADGLFRNALGLKTNSWVTVHFQWTGSAPLSAVVGHTTLRAAPRADAAVIGLAADRAGVPVECAVGSGADRWLRVGVDQYLRATAVPGSAGVRACGAGPVAVPPTTDPPAATPPPTTPPPATPPPTTPPPTTPATTAPPTVTAASTTPATTAPTTTTPTTTTAPTTTAPTTTAPTTTAATTSPTPTPSAAASAAPPLPTSALPTPTPPTPTPQTPTSPTSTPQTPTSPTPTLPTPTLPSAVRPGNADAIRAAAVAALRSALGRPACATEAERAAAGAALEAVLAMLVPPPDATDAERAAGIAALRAALTLPAEAEGTVGVEPTAGSGAGAIGGMAALVPDPACRPVELGVVDGTEAGAPQGG